MTMWVVHLPEDSLPSDAEVEAGAETTLPLPFEVPDISRAPHLWDVKHVLAQHLPDSPPEVINRLSERYHRYINEFHVDDLLVLPHLARETLYFAQALGKPRHQEGQRWAVSVRWFQRAVPMRRFRRFGRWYESSEPMFELDVVQLRTLLRDQLPIKGNRFGKVRWIIVIMVLVQALYFAKRVFVDKAF